MDVHRAHHLGGFGESGERVLEVVVLAELDGVAELQDQVRLRRAGWPHEQQWLARDRGDRHEIDDVLPIDEEPAERGPEAVQPLPQIVCLFCEVFERKSFDVVQLSHVAFSMKGRAKMRCLTRCSSASMMRRA